MGAVRSRCSGMPVGIWASCFLKQKQYDCWHVTLLGEELWPMLRELQESRPVTRREPGTFKREDGSATFPSLGNFMF